ncbi:MAG: hypothetical protein M0R06_03140 [Sphaerochaeta sp.]|nr:hypothetical protein [Sphaerochaeta sp.]
MLVMLVFLVVVFWPVLFGGRNDGGAMGTVKIVRVCKKSGMMPTSKCPKTEWRMVPGCFNSWLWQTPCILHPED